MKRNKQVLIFKSEYEILKQVEDALNDNKLSKEALVEMLSMICRHYKKLLKVAVKLTKISDTYQLKLQVAKDLAEEKNEALEEAMAEIETLSGLLPICANCKQIRDDNGAWHPIESYISTHSHAEFSHSLCPKCFKKLYPKYSKKI
jgi:hypothetical protein